jgi:hypothetical protein
MSHPLDSRSPAARPNVRSASMRKLGKDGTTWTPTEQRKRDQLLKQFTHGQRGYNLAEGNSEAYRANFELIDWGKG